MNATTKRWRLNRKQLIDGVKQSIIAALAGYMLPLLNEWVDGRPLVFTDFKLAIKVSIAAGLSYIFHKFIENSDGHIFKKEKTKR